MARSNRKNLSTVLPPPDVSPLRQVLSVCYSREFNTIYMLINHQEIWVYTTRYVFSKIRFFIFFFFVLKSGTAACKWDGFFLMNIIVLLYIHKFVYRIDFGVYALLAGISDFRVKLSKIVHIYSCTVWISAVVSLQLTAFA